MNKLDVATVKALFPKVDGLPTEEGWYLFIAQSTIVITEFTKGRLRDLEDNGYVPKGIWYGPIPLNQIAEILKDD